MEAYIYLNGETAIAINAQRSIGSALRTHSQHCDATVARACCATPLYYCVPGDSLSASSKVKIAPLLLHRGNACMLTIYK